MDIKKTSKLGVNDNAVYLITSEKEIPAKAFSNEELNYIKKEIKAKHKQIEINRYTSTCYCILLDKENDYKVAENARIAAYNLTSTLNTAKIKAISIVYFLLF